MAQKHIPSFGGWKIVGCLHDSEFPELLDPVMVEATHPRNKLLIYAGWEPEGNPFGSYVVGVLNGCDSLQDPIYVGSTYEAKMIFEAFMKSLAGSGSYYFSPAAKKLEKQSGSITEDYFDLEPETVPHSEKILLTTT